MAANGSPHFKTNLLMGTQMGKDTRYNMSAGRENGNCVSCKLAVTPELPCACTLHRV